MCAKVFILKGKFLQEERSTRGPCLMIQTGKESGFYLGNIVFPISQRKHILKFDTIFPVYSNIS